MNLPVLDQPLGGVASTLSAGSRQDGASEVRQIGGGIAVPMIDLDGRDVDGGLYFGVRDLFAGEEEEEEHHSPLVISQGAVVPRRA